jgi:hypothetical protein
LYEDKYFKEYDDWILEKTTSSTATATATATDMTTIRDTINDFYGEIIIGYNEATSSFVYYARTANIPYKYLETAARKYMIDTNAPVEIYVDIRKEYEKAKEQAKPENTTTTTTTTTATTTATTNNTADNVNIEDDDYKLFANFKSYNTVSNVAASNIKKEPQNTSSSASATTASTSSANSTTKQTILRERANRYSYRGKIEDYNESTDTEKTTEINIDIPKASSSLSSSSSSSYSDFKKTQNKTA